MKLLLFPAVEDERLARIMAAADDLEVINAASEEEAARNIVDADAMFGKITPPLLARAERLRWVQSATASLEHYVFPELIAHECALTNMRGIYSDVIADQVMGYVICFARNLHLYIRQQVEARWEPIGGESERTNFVSGPGAITGLDRNHLHLSTHCLGVIGLGAIGREIATRARAFNLRVVAVDAQEVPPPEGCEFLGTTSERLPDLLAQSDFVVIAAPHTPETEKLFRASVFQQMKSTAYLINIGRGAIVDLADLTAALRSGEIAGAALDVFEVEPLPSDHPLWAMENVIITPHMAGCSPEIPERHLGVLLDNIGRFSRGEPLRNVTDKAMWF